MTTASTVRKGTMVRLLTGHANYAHARSPWQQTILPLDAWWWSLMCSVSVSQAMLACDVRDVHQDTSETLCGQMGNVSHVTAKMETAIHVTLLLERVRTQEALMTVKSVTCAW